MTRSHIVKIELDSWGEWRVTTNMGRGSVMVSLFHPVATKAQALELARKFGLLK